MEYRDDNIQSQINEKFEPSIPVEQKDSSENINNTEDSKTIKRPLKRRKKRRRFKYVGPDPRRFKIVLGIIAIIVIYLALRILPIPFGNVIITGDTNITTQALIDTGVIAKPVNILKVSRSEVQTALENDLRVESVTSEYIFPATLEFDLKKRESIANVISRYGYAEIDTKGQYISLNNSISPKKIPIISGIQLGNILLGDYVNNPKVKEGVKYLQAIGVEGRKVISEINVGNEDKLIAYTVDGVRIDLGKPEKLEEKAKLTLQMLKDISRQHIEVNTLDVNLDAPYVKKK